MKDSIIRTALLIGLSGAAGACAAELLYSDTFDGGTLSNWVGEGVTPTIVDGQLDLNTPDGGATIWLNRAWSGNIRIEYDVHMLGTRDLNSFWMASDPNHPDDFFAADRSSGNFSLYNSMELYYVGFGAGGNVNTRGRKYFDNTKPLLLEYTEQPNLLNGPGATYRVRLVQNEGVIEYWIDQRDGRGIQKIWDYDDNADSDGNGDAYTEGYFGIRAFETHYRIDNLTVEAIPEPSTVPLMGLGLVGIYLSRKRIRKPSRRD